MSWGKAQTKKSKLHTLVDQLTKVRDGLKDELVKTKQELVEAKQKQGEEQGG